MFHGFHSRLAERNGPADGIRRDHISLVIEADIYDHPALRVGLLCQRRINRTRGRNQFRSLHDLRCTRSRDFRGHFRRRRRLAIGARAERSRRSSGRRRGQCHIRRSQCRSIGNAGKILGRSDRGTHLQIANLRAGRYGSIGLFRFGSACVLPRILRIGRSGRCNFRGSGRDGLHGRRLGLLGDRFGGRGARGRVGCFVGRWDRGLGRCDRCGGSLARRGSTMKEKVAAANRRKNQYRAAQHQRHTSARLIGHGQRTHPRKRHAFPGGIIRGRLLAGRDRNRSRHCGIGQIFHRQFGKWHCGFARGNYSRGFGLELR